MNKQGENTDILEYQTTDVKLPCLPLSMMLIAFLTSHSLHTKGHSGAEKTFISKIFINKIFISQMHQIR